ncbi:hypothetical protein [Corallococcus sp. 4LFB]|uniref:hypothetical protein n=1 Tax=Corallococcus sp. 4LFB TaxID=3383249 RepID=UPI00397636B6
MPAPLAAPGPVMHAGMQALCAHFGQARPLVLQPRVRLGGNPVVTVPRPFQPFLVTGCPSRPLFCVVGQWLTGTRRVSSMGLPLLLTNGTSTSLPLGPPMRILPVASRVRAR